MNRLQEPALRALEWIDKWGDRDGDGFVEYQRRSERGLENQSWKDSGDSQRFADGRIAKTPIAPCEVQGYVFDAKRRMAEIAREVWRDRELADRLNAEAKELRERSTTRTGSTGAAATTRSRSTRDKQPVDSMCSNMGHLLWSGIVPPQRVDAVVDALMGDALWSGWGVRTMSDQDAAYNPLSYHNGTVWPHDNSLIAWGLARYGRWPEAQRIAQRLLQAARYFNYQLPEVFAGLRRSETTFPIAYPTAARPQAWAAGTPVLLLQVLLGLQPDIRRHALETVAPAELPSWVENAAAARVCERSTGSGTCGSTTVTCGWRRREGASADRGARAAVVRRAADRLRRHRVGRLAARRRARRRRPRRHALRVGRLAHAREARVGLRDRAERADRPDVLGAPARALAATSASTSST